MAAGTVPGAGMRAQQRCRLVLVLHRQSSRCTMA